MREAFLPQKPQIVRSEPLVAPPREARQCEMICGETLWGARCSARLFE
jgi:hypothetical protein